MGVVGEGHMESTRWGGKLIVVCKVNGYESRGSSGKRDTRGVSGKRG